MSQQHHSLTVNPSFRVVDPLPGSQPLFGLPDVEIFAVRLTPIVIAGFAGLALAFGWRGLVAGGILFYIWASSAPTPTPSGAGPGTGTGGRPGTAGRGGGSAPAGVGGGARPADIFQQLQTSVTSGLQQFGVGAGPGNAGGSTSGLQRGSGVAGSGSAAPASSSVFQGRGQKLGGSS